MTFNELVNNTPKTAIEKDALRIMTWADRPYMDDGRPGRYLEDFLAENGEKEVCPIDAEMGCPVSRGRGIWVTLP
jgi:hypothetical protein